LKGHTQASREASKVRHGFTQISGTLLHFIHKHFIWIIVSSYIVAAIFPDLGLLMRHIEFGSVDILRTKITVSLPPVMLAFLLFNAGLGIRANELIDLKRKPALLIAGAAGNILVPLAFVACVNITMKFWPEPDEVQQILTGLALVASMPIAGASTAWAQNANGNLTLSLGLILLTTLSSPILTPLVLHAGGFITSGDYSDDLHGLARSGADLFLGVWVILPSLLGILTHRMLGEKRSALISPYVKLANFIVLALLNYSNASLTLPGVISQPDLDFVTVMLIIVFLLGFAMFGAGYFLARVFRAGRPEMASLMFGLGMNNNGAGLVMASFMFYDHPNVLLPIIFYNLVQHFIAALVDKLLSTSASGESN
jgi:BASS family bile acid:Na+ symporter